MTPLEIEILLHYHYSPNDYPNLDAPAIYDAVCKFVQYGILRQLYTSLHQCKKGFLACLLILFLCFGCSKKIHKKTALSKPITLSLDTIKRQYICIFQDTIIQK